jgi:hypothetical protein
MDELIELDQRINHKIAQTKDKMHKTRERVVTDHLWPEIETLTGSYLDRPRQRI